MQFKWHILIGFIVSFILVRFVGFSPIAGLTIFLASFLIDVDHYLWYAVEMKDWNPLHAIEWYNKSIPRWALLSRKEKNEFKQGIFILHSIGFLIITFLLSYTHAFFLWIFIGATIHLGSDILNYSYRGESIYYKICPRYVIKRNKGKRPLREL
jgi:hypothetical protein